MASKRSSAHDLIVVGGGPAGMMAGLLFARAGVTTKVIEKHADFFRDFRGDTVHPSTMEILDQLGLLDRFLKRPASASTLRSRTRSPPPMRSPHRCRAARTSIYSSPRFRIGDFFRHG